MASDLVLLALIVRPVVRKPVTVMAVVLVLGGMVTTWK